LISSRRSEGLFSPYHHIHTSFKAYPDPYPVGTGAFSLGIKRLECEANHFPPSSDEVKNALSYAFIPKYVFMA
jgi:hypothetical protein